MKLNESILYNLKEGKDEEQTCVLCGKKFVGWGNDAWPLADGYCCDDCNSNKVVPARIAQVYGIKEADEIPDPEPEPVKKEIYDFKEKLQNALEGAGYKLDVKAYNENEPWYVIIASKNGLETAIGLSGPNETYDYDAPTVDVGGDWSPNTEYKNMVSPIHLEGWNEESGSPTGSTKVGSETYCVWKSIKDTSPEEVVNLIDVSFDRHSSKNESDKSLKEDEVVEKKLPEDKFLNSDIDVYDLQGIVDVANKDNGTDYEVHMDKERALLQDVNGRYILSDYEAVRDFADGEDDDVIEIYLSEKGKETKNDDGSVTRTFSIVPKASIKVSPADIKKYCPVKKMKASEFFNKRDYNPRCENNFRGLMRNLNGEYLRESANLKESKYPIISPSFETEGNSQYGSGSNDEMYAALKELEQYFNDFYDTANKNQFHYQGVKLPELKNARDSITKAREELEKAWDL